MRFKYKVCIASNFEFLIFSLDLPGFVFNVDVMKNLKMKEFQGRIKFMLYNGKFWDYYYDYPKLKGRHILAFLLGTLILSAQVIIDVFIIHLTRDH